MTVTGDSVTRQAGPRMARLADDLVAKGVLRCGRWRDAVLAVPRHPFLPRFYRDREDGVREPVTREGLGDAAWLDLVYSDETWVTQVDDGDDLWSDSPRPQDGASTCSSTMPSLVVGMLEALDVEDGHRVLEIGTGTGYSTALLCHRLGSDRVVSVEYDPGLSRRAGSALAALGYHPTLAVGDGGDGWPASAPYDRVVGTCSFTHVPYAWVAQTRPGGLVEAILGGSITGGPPVVLKVHHDGTASGMLGASMLWFMRSRPQRRPPMPEPIVPMREPAREHPADVDPAVLANRTCRFLLQWRIPGLTVHSSLRSPSGEALFRTRDLDGWVAVYADGDGAVRVRQADPADSVWADLDDSDLDPAYVRRVCAYASTRRRERECVGAVGGGDGIGGAPWPVVEDTARTWNRLGRPGLDRFRLTVTPDEQALTIPGTDLHWTQPSHG
jgi:methyltransferase of ATP-grasp peptide maturase system